MRSKHVTPRLRADVVESIDVDAAVALDDVDAGEAVGRVMRNGILHTTPSGGTATGITVTAGAAGGAVGVTDFEGVDDEIGTVKISPVPAVTEDGVAELPSVDWTSYLPP